MGLKFFIASRRVSCSSIQTFCPGKVTSDLTCPSSHASKPEIKVDVHWPLYFLINYASKVSHVEQAITLIKYFHNNCFLVLR